MRLDFTVMWVDDEINASGNDTQIREMEAFLTEKGLRLNAVKIADKNELDNFLIEDQSRYIDFIFMDNKFDDKELGVRFIEQIRGQGIYAEIIFYSSNIEKNSLEGHLKNEGIQGVYVYTKQEIGDNFEFVTDIIDYRIQREMDVMSLRGMTMAMVAEFDRKIFTILESAGFKDNMIQSVQKKLNERIKDNSGLVNEKEKIWDQLGSDKSTMIWDSYSRGMKFFSKEVCDCEQLELREEESRNNNQRYKNLIQKRNKLAHSCSGSLSEIFAVCGNEQNDDALNFDDDLALLLRKDLLEFSNLFNNIENKVCLKD